MTVKPIKWLSVKWDMVVERTAMTFSVPVGEKKGVPLHLHQWKI